MNTRRPLTRFRRILTLTFKSAVACPGSPPRRCPLRINRDVSPRESTDARAQAGSRACEVCDVGCHLSKLPLLGVLQIPTLQAAAALGMHANLFRNVNPAIR
jgi:hypothetical protein